MTPEYWQEVKRLLAAALEKTPAERSAFLDSKCPDPDLRREVESQLATHNGAPFSTAQGKVEHAGESGNQGGHFSPSEAPTLVTDSMNPPKSGERLGPYEIVARIGAGGMGEVYRARDHRLERDVAIKIFAPWRRFDDSARRRFRIEALALAKLNHPNIASVYDVGEQDGRDFLVMEYVPGESLAQKVKSGPLPLPQALVLGQEIAQALEEAHDHGIVHRDLKLANVIVTPKGHAKVLDFGLAKLLADEGATDATLSIPETIGPVGTPLYMSPEQAEGKAVDSRSDVWSLGVVLYELLAGKRPFDGSSVMALHRAITGEKEKPLRGVRPELPAETEKIVSRALEKDPSKRYRSAAEMGRDISSELLRISASAGGTARREVRFPVAYASAGALALIAVLIAGAWFYHRLEQREWARDQAIPEIAKLQDERKALAAFLLLKKAEQILPGDPRLAQLASQNTQTVSITSSPAGATVEIKDYLSPNDTWYRLGTTPLNNVRIPAGYFRWRVSKDGVGTYEAAPPLSQKLNFALDKEASAPAGMSWVSGGPWVNYIGFVGTVGPYRLPPFYIDRYEVTNREYQKFVDAGGYAKRQYWTEKFVRDGREMKWEDAVALFRDSTGRPGPSTWEGGHYPAGQGDYPVSGVSWFEASAYAAFAGKSLPAFAQWYAAANPDVGDYIVQDSNISLSKLAPVGAYQGLGEYGTYDMAGNVREWALNDTGKGTKFILGGSWRAQTYFYGSPEALSPFDRSAENGFRCVRNPAPLSAALLNPVKKMERDFSKFKPAPDDVYRAYLQLYAYDKTPLNAKVEGIVGETDDWREEKISFDTAYNNQRMSAYLFLPKHVKPPYQTVVFSPSARVLDLHDSSKLGDVTFFDYVVQSGRAVLYPVYYGTYERQGPTVYVGAAQQLTYLADRSKDLGRSLDYLATRPDIDTSKIAYLGVSMGSAEGVIYTAIAQSRLKTVIFLDGGYFLDQPPAGGDQADFAPRLKLPTLMVNGRYDFVFSLKECQDPLFRMLGTADADKQHVVLDTPHDVRERRSELIKIVLGWLDKYLGRVE